MFMMTLIIFIVSNHNFRKWPSTISNNESYFICMTRICSCEHLHLWKMKLKFFFVFLCHISLFRNYLMPFYVFCLCLSMAGQSVQRWLYVVKLWVCYLLQLFEIKILLAKCSHHFILNTWSSAVGLPVVKQFPPLINFVFFKVTETMSICWISNWYLTSAITAELQWHVSNIDIIP